MKNTRRRKRRNSPSRKRSHSSKRAVQALAAGAMIAAGTQAYAEPIRFDNPAGPGHFVWLGSGPQELGRWLDVTVPAESQLNYQVGYPGRILRGAYGGYGYLSGGQVDLETDGAEYLVGLGEGQFVPTGAPWGAFGWVDYYGSSLLPEGVATYLGVRFDRGSGFQYAWVGVLRTGVDLEPFAWGYETEPGVPIPAGIPEPGTLAALALGAAAALTSRRRVRSQID